MATIVGILTIHIRIPEARTLKNKRSVVRSLIQQIKNNHNVSVAEVGRLDNPSHATIAVVTVSNEMARVERVLSAVQTTVSREFRIVIVSVATEIV